MASIDVDQTDVSEKVYDVIEALVKSSSLDIACAYEDLPSDPDRLPCIDMETLTGDPVEKSYPDGAPPVLRYRFALKLRQSPVDTENRLEALNVLRQLSQAFVRADLDFGEDYGIWNKAIDTIPSSISADTGFDDYQVTLILRYRTTKGV